MRLGHWPQYQGFQASVPQLPAVEDASLILGWLQADAAVLAGVRRRFGDFLYSKRDYDQAMEQ